MIKPKKSSVQDRYNNKAYRQGTKPSVRKTSVEKYKKKI